MPATTTKDLIQTIVSLRELQQRDEAAQLVRQQFQLQGQEFAFNQGVTQENLLSGIANLAGTVTDKNALHNLVPFLASRVGTSEDNLHQLINSVPRSTETTKAGVISRGVDKLGAGLEAPAATAAMTGTLPGGLTQDEFQGMLTKSAQTWLAAQTPEQRDALNAQLFSQRALGKSLPEVINDHIYSTLPPEFQKQATLIGMKLAPDASSDLQHQLGTAQVNLEHDRLLEEGKDRDIRLKLAFAEAQQKLDKDKVSLLGETLQHQATFLQDAAKNGSTLTPAGLLQYNATINGFNEQLRRVAPEIFGRKDPVTGQITGGTVQIPDLPLTGGGVGAQGMLNPNYFKK